MKHWKFHIYTLQNKNILSQFWSCLVRCMCKESVIKIIISSQLTEEYSFKPEKVFCNSLSFLAFFTMQDKDMHSFPVLHNFKDYLMSSLFKMLTHYFFKFCQNFSPTFVYFLSFLAFFSQLFRCFHPHSELYPSLDTSSELQFSVAFSNSISASHPQIFQKPQYHRYELARGPQIP